MLVVALALLPGVAVAREVAHLYVTLNPERLGHGTTIQFGFDIGTTDGAVPSPVTRIELRYPAHVGIVTSGLGVATCETATIEAQGPEHCPSRSLMGFGQATAEVKVGTYLVQEYATTEIFMAPFSSSGISVQFSVSGYSPLMDDLLFPGSLESARAPFGGDLVIPVPLLESFPDGPYVSLVRVSSTIGPRGITYYKHRHGAFVPYHPSGIVLPARCPAGGFPFSVSFKFLDGTSAISSVAVPCPRG